jgi:hypothetical protein
VCAPTPDKILVCFFFIQLKIAKNLNQVCATRIYLNFLQRWSSRVLRVAGV